MDKTEKDIIIDTRKIIFEKMEKLQRSKQTLKKFFVFSHIDLKDDYEGCIEVIESYIEEHKDKILDFEFESWIDEVVMSPVIMMKIELVPEISRHIGNMSILNNLLPSSTESDILREDISEIFSRYSWELNEKETRKKLLQDLKFKLLHGPSHRIDDIEDRTENSHIDKGETNFVIKSGNLEMSLHEYLEHLSKQGRFEDNN